MKKVVVIFFLVFLVFGTFASRSWAGTCPSGIGCDSGILNLPCDPVTVTHGPWLGGTNSTLDITLSNVPGGFDVTDGTTYTGWCIEDNLQADLNAPLSLVDSTCDQVDLPSTYQGIPWDKVNYLLNHKIGTFLDVQNALYYVAGADSAATPAPNANVQAMIDDANANGNGFVAGPGQVTAVVIFADGIGKFGATPDNNQDTIIEVPVPDLCGDGIVGNTPGETCDPPGSPAGASGNLCRNDCTVCGDGILDPGESCDDGNNISGDGCEPDCTPTLVCDDRKTDFTISLTPKEKFVWMTSQPYNQRGNQIQAYDGETGYMFCWAINDEFDQLERAYNKLKGDATVIGGTGSAFNYNAIPSQALQEFNPDKTLHLDGVEYSAGPSQIMLEGLAGVPGAIQGTLAVVNPGIDFVQSMQPEFNINLTCWNELESKSSRHVHFKDFEQYDLTKDLQLDLSKIFTLGWHCAATSTHAMWAVLHQNLTPVFQWGDSVWQHPESCVPSTVVLPGATGNNGAAGTNGVTCNNVHEPGSLLVYPLIDNINANTIVNIANTGDQDVVLECVMVSAPCRP